ncbi:hypothetical protein [Chitinophaga rhizophila]|uniref:Uncharacterized protein n=1 Tax=Chitinophaga rhizophila TaxID=2866212 RepID=A0ABS7G9W7_9BACT|nr:hypothetical protein [Chitinophaga rhizophila]MBW8683522.1 hypothetical protein [Chitinophaga rhizophila]
MTRRIAGTPPEHNRNRTFNFLHQKWVKKAYLTPGLTLAMTLTSGSETQAYMAVLPFCTGLFLKLFSRLLFPLSFTNFHRMVAGISYPVFIVGMAYSLGFSPVTLKNENL